MIECDIVIIDSGLDSTIGGNVPGICIRKSEEKYLYTGDFSDTIGHGTIIYSVINKQVSSSAFFIIKVDDETCENEFNSSLLIAALEYVRNNIKCKLINISLGVKICEDFIALYGICSKLKDDGVVIVSAFDNDGCHSYPAAFDCVIGVDSNNEFKLATEYDIVKNSPINVLAKGSLQRLTLSDGRLLLVGGSSIACAHITAFLANEINTLANFDNALVTLEKKARHLLVCRETDNIESKFFKINNAVVFPFSKEQHAFVRFSDMLSFKIKAYYDVKFSGKVGRKVSDICIGTYVEEVVRDIDKIDFEGVDTLILGHLDELNSVLKHDYRLDMINKAIEKRINIYSFDPLDDYIDRLNYSGINFFYPHISIKEVPNGSFGKLYKISKPVVGIFGTASQQGKFSVQLALKKELEAMDYNVGTVGTEPHALLFGFDTIFPIGYNSTVNIKNQDVVLYLNYTINQMCMNGKEIILAASQAQTIPFYCNNLLEYPSLQFHYALGIKPDAVIICINYHDELDYILNTVYTIKGLTDASLLAFVMYPMTFFNEWSHAKRRITNEEFSEKKNELRKVFDVPVYLLGEQNIENLCQNIIDYF